MHVKLKLWKQPTRAFFFYKKQLCLNFTIFFMIAFQQNSSGRLLPITLKNYLIMFERVAKLSGKKKKIYIYIDIWGKYWIWAWRHLNYKFRLSYILLDFDCKSFEQLFIITLITYFTSPRLEKTWTTNLDYNYILYYGIWTWNYLDQQQASGVVL